MSSIPDTPAGPEPRGLLSLWPYAVVLAVGFFVLLPELGNFGFWDPWEPKYAETAREMNERGSYIVPFYRESVRLTKPILVYWGVLAGAAVFGLNEFGARIVGVGFALAAMAGLYYSISQLRGRQAGLISALVLGTVPQFYFISRQAMPDVYLFTTLGMCLMFFCLALLGPPGRRDLHFGISYACIALAVLAKGPVIIGTVLLTTLGIWTVAQIDLQEVWKPGRRRETVQFGLIAPVGLALMGLLSFTAYLFGTSPLWWGYSGQSREEMALVHNGIADTFGRFRISEILLSLIAASAVAGAVWMARSGRARGGIPFVRVTLAALAGVAALVSLTGDSGLRIFAAALLGSVACACGVGIAFRRFVLQEWLWPILGPILKEIGRQLLRFAVVFLIIAGPWHLGIFIEQGHGYVTDFLIKHNIHRAEETVNRSGVSEFYLRVLIFGYFPWSCFLPVAVAGLVGWWEQNPLKRYGIEAFLLIASVVTFTAFTGSATKFAHYLSPIMIPVTALIGLAISRTLDRRNTAGARLAWIVAAMLFLLPTIDLLSEDGLVYLVGSFTMKRWVPESLAPGPYMQGLLIAFGACLFASILWRSRLLVIGLIASAALLANYHTSYFIPALSQHKTMKHLCDTWKAHAPSGDPPICFFGDVKHGVFYYTEYRVETMETRREFEAFMNPEERRFCIVERDNLPTLQSNQRAKHDGARFYVADDSHFAYQLISNFPLPRLTAGDVSAER